MADVLAYQLAPLAPTCNELSDLIALVPVNIPLVNVLSSFILNQASPALKASFSFI